MKSSVVFSRKSIEWETPQDFFDKLNEKHHFDLDPCATAENAKCKSFFTREQDGLKQDWHGRSVFCNPPYGRELALWVAKCAAEAHDPSTRIVMLIPARTDTKWFHDYIYRKPNVKIEFLKGRLKFSEAENYAPFPIMCVTFN